MTAYYNEIDPKAAAWLRELIKQGHIAPGDVDERSIEDVTAADLAGYTQCHFFAGIGVWSYALRQAGWSDDAVVWTGSCPCQPFSSAGKGKGLDDHRHLWPHFHRLIAECRPVHVFGEQVANKAGEAWFDIVQTDLETENYASGLSVFPACGVGAPHMRKRLYWVAEDTLADTMPAGRTEGRTESGSGQVAGGGPAGELAVHQSERRGEEGGCVLRQEERAGERSDAGELADADNARPQRHAGDGDRSGEPGRQHAKSDGQDLPCDRSEVPGPTNGLWGAADWLYCRDGKWRPVEPGTFPLAHGAPARVGRLRGYGNAIVAPQAQAFIEAYMEIAKSPCTPHRHSV